MIQYWRLFAMSIVVTLWFLTAGALAQEPYAISVETANRVTVQVNGRPALIDSSPAALEHKLTGTEASECRPYGRASNGTARASTRILSRNPGSVSLAFQGDTIAQGGHYRTCGGCLAGNCVAFSGHDTSAHTEANSTARIAIRFHEKLLHNVYDLRIATAGETNSFAVTVTSPAGVVTRLADNDSGVHRIKAEDNDVYYVDLKLGVAASDRGGCCDAKKGASVQVSVHLQKVPILDLTKGFEPFIVGGTRTDGYKNVIALLLDGKMHCSGTVIGSRTLLTAAHCLHGYEPQIREGRMSFVTGAEIARPDSSGFIEDFDFPRGDGLRYNPSLTSLEHDIGVVYTRAPTAVAAATLHANVPAWNAIPNNLYLEFVGFGLTRWDRADAGVKHEAGWKVSSVDDRRFYFSTSRSRTGIPAKGTQVAPPSSFRTAPASSWA